MGTGVVFSFFGTIIGIALLIVLTPILCDVALMFQAYEYCALALFSLSMVIALTGHDMPKGLISAVLGGLLATVGLALIDSRPRFTFGIYQMNNGFALVVLLIGLFAISEVMAYAETVRQRQDYTINEDFKIKGAGFSFKEFVEQVPNMIVSALIGVGIGILPGIGGGVSCMISYTVSKNTSKHRELYGTGIMDGVVAPGPLIYEKNGQVVYAIFFAMVIAAIFMLFFMLLGMRFFVRVLKVPKNYLLPVVLVLCGIGAIGEANMVFDTYVMVGFGLMAYLLVKAKIPTVPMILGFILGPTFEENLRRCSQLASSDPFWNHPIFCVLIVATILVVIFSVRSNIKDAKRAEQEELAKEQGSN